MLACLPACSLVCSLHSNELPSLPAEIGRLTECVRLSLYQNRLTTLPPEIGGMTGLQVCFFALMGCWAQAAAANDCYNRLW